MTMATSLDHVYGELAPMVRRLQLSCQSRTLLPLTDVLTFLQRLSTCQPQDLIWVVGEAPELHCFIALQDALQGNVGQETNLDEVQIRVVEALCEKRGGRVAPLANCRKALRAIFLHYEGKEISVKHTVKLLSECVKQAHWQLAKLIVGCLSQHLIGSELGVMEQKVLGVLRDSLVPYSVCCLILLLEPLHKLIFNYLNSLMAQGNPPEARSIPPAIKWYMRLLRKCTGKVTRDVTQVEASKITRTDLDFLFWPFNPSLSVSCTFEPPERILSLETGNWSSRYVKEIKSWCDHLQTMLLADLKITKTRSKEVMNEGTGYHWHPFTDYILSPNEWIGLHDLLLHKNIVVKDLESQFLRYFKASAMGEKTLGIGAALVEILAQEMQMCHCQDMQGNQQSDLPVLKIRHNNHASECCGCINQGSKAARHAGTLLIWLLRPSPVDTCSSTWVLIFKNLLLAVPAVGEEFALQYHAPVCKPLTARFETHLPQTDTIPLPALQSTFVTLIKQEVEMSQMGRRKGVVGNLTEALKNAEKSRWRLEHVVWPTFKSQLKCQNFLVAYYYGLESLVPYGLQYEDSGERSLEYSIFPRLQLSMDDFLEVVKLEPRYILPLLKFMKPSTKLTAIESVKQGTSQKPSTGEQDPLWLDLHVLQWEEFLAAVNSYVLQEISQEDLQLDLFVMRVAAFSSGSFRFLFGEHDEYEDTHRKVNTRKSGSQDFSRFFGRGNDRGDDGIAQLTTSFEGRLFLAEQLNHWEKVLQGVSTAEAANKCLELNRMKAICSHISGLYCKFPHVDAGVCAGLSVLWRAMDVKEEDALWEFESHAKVTEKDVRSAKRPRLSSWTQRILVNSSGKTNEDPEWIVEAICRSSDSLEKHLPVYLNLKTTTGLRTDENQVAGRKINAPPGAVSLRQQTLLSYLTKFSSKIPHLATLCGNMEVLQVAWEAMQAAALLNSANNESDVFELWFQFLEKFREQGSSIQYIRKLMGHNIGVLGSMVQYALLSPCLIRNWPRELLENLVGVSTGIVRRICDEAKVHVASLSAADSTTSKGLVDFILSGVVLAMDKNPKAVAEYLEVTLALSCEWVGDSSKFSPSSRSSLLELVSMAFAICRPDSREAVLSYLGTSDLYKNCIQGSLNIMSPTRMGTASWMTEELGAEGRHNKQQVSQIWPSFVLAVLFWEKKVLDALYNSGRCPQSGNSRQCGSGGLDIVSVLGLSMSEQRAGICHILATCQPHAHCRLQGGVQGSKTPSLVSCEEMIGKLEALSSIQDSLSLHQLVNSWILLCCKMNISLNMDHIGALCRLHPSTIRNPLISQIEDDLVEAKEMGGKGLDWKSSLEVLMARLTHGFLACLPLDARLHLTTAFDVVPGGFCAKSNGVYLEQIMSCLGSTDSGVRRSTYCFVVANQHHHQFVNTLTLELCKKVPLAELTAEQEALLRVLMPIFVHDPVHGDTVIVDSVLMLLEEVKSKSCSLQSYLRETDGIPNPATKQQVEALLRVTQLACQASPHTFAKENIAEFLSGLAKLQEPLEEIAVIAIRCLTAIAGELPPTIKYVNLVQDLLHHLLKNNSGERAAVRIEGKLSHRRQSTHTRCLNADKELFTLYSLQRAIPLRAILQQFRVLVAENCEE